MAGFCGFWLMGWVVGEVLAIQILATFVGELSRSVPLSQLRGLTGQGDVGVTLTPLFLSFWLALWTPAGFAVAFGLFAALAGAEHLSFDRRGVERASRLGPFRFGVQRVAFADLVDLYPLQGVGAVVGLLRTGRKVTLASAGTKDQHTELLRWWREFSRLPLEDAALASHVPMNREVVSERAGRTVLRKAARVRRIAAWAWWVTAGLLAFNLGILLWRRLFGADGVIETLATLGLAALTWLTARQAWRESWGLQWWEVGPERFVRVTQGRFSSRRQAHRVRRLVVTAQRDDEDGDHSWALWLHDEQDGKVALIRGSKDAREVEHLGLWLAQRTRVSFEREALSPPLAEPAVATGRRR
ncbi:hypothetical protein LZ198_19835 [Myxococcus sp. K15C18031901]|uniref:hypothetical protein n=1 Tax=Myxococcus dinghuensis TaxID=2906761 RepID=UPI0020A7EE4C|nr:hypothetical protein [Myxococcus dinghuensis]MCP3101130.1 hypothetical protein [Myxococcus dinghuensis]